MMKVYISKDVVEWKIRKLNQWLFENLNSREEKAKKQELTYYAMKAQEMEEKNLKKIEVWKIQN